MSTDNGHEVSAGEYELRKLKRVFGLKKWQEQRGMEIKEKRGTDNE